MTGTCHLEKFCLGMATTAGCTCNSLNHTYKGVNMRSKLNRLVTVSVFFMLGLVIAASGFQMDAVASELDLFLGK